MEKDFIQNHKNTTSTVTGKRDCRGSQIIRNMKFQ